MSANPSGSALFALNAGVGKLKACAFKCFIAKFSSWQALGRAVKTHPAARNTG